MQNNSTKIETTGANAIRSTQLSEVIKSLYAIKRTLCVEGPPGGGKTSIVRQAANQLGVQYIERHMPTMLVEDFGIPVPDNGTLRYQIPEWFPTDPTSEGILCFDDRNQASADLQKVLANICQARNLHGVPLPPGWMVVSTGNRQSDRAGANRVLSHLRNRETAIELVTSMDDWVNWALANEVRSEVISFIRFKPSMLHDFDPQRDANPTPRSWVDGVSAVLDVVPKSAEFACFVGAVGEGAATEFNAFLKIYRELPDPDAIIAKPDSSDVPTSPSTLYALTGALSARTNKDTIGNVMKYLRRMPGEFGVMLVLSVLGSPKTAVLAAHPSVADWIRDNKHIILGQH
jgi:hypothetical protein